MRQHTSRITGSLSVSGSGNVDFTSVKSGVSGSFRLSDIKASLPTGTVSSSAQIDAQISASFAQSSAVSASFAQKKAVTGSFALKATISGSYLGQGVVTSSAQLATDISGSLGANASLIRSLTATGVSGSLGTNASLIRSLTATAISGSVVAGVSGSALSTGSFGRLQLGGDGNITGKLTVGGRLTAQEFHTEFVSSSIIFQSGSTKFGDSAADTHTFTGKMEISGSQAKVSASVGATGSFGHLFLAKGAHVTDRLYFSDVGGEYISGDGTDLNLVSGNDINVPTDIGLTFGNDGEKIEGNGTRLSIASGTGMVLDCEGDIEINADGGDVDFKDDSAHLLKVSSTKISGSAASTGSFGRLEGSVFSGSFIGKGTFNNIDDPTAMAIALG